MEISSRKNSKNSKKKRNKPESKNKKSFLSNPKDKMNLNPSTKPTSKRC